MRCTAGIDARVPRRKTFVNTSSIDVNVKGILRHPGIYAGKIDEMTRLSVRRTPLFDESWGGWLPHSELRRLRKAMGYQDLRRRVLGKPLNEVPQRYSTIYLRDDVGMLHGAVVLACRKTTCSMLPWPSVVVNSARPVVRKG